MLLTQGIHSPPGPAVIDVFIWIELEGRCERADNIDQRENHKRHHKGAAQFGSPGETLLVHKAPPARDAVSPPPLNLNAATTFGSIASLSTSLSIQRFPPPA